MMEVTVTHHIDASDPDAKGMHDYYYEYNLYRFCEGATTLTARSYIDTPNEAHFLNIERSGTPRLLRKADLQSPLFMEAADYLRAAGKRKLSWLSGRGSGYEPVPGAGPSAEYLG